MKLEPRLRSGFGGAAPSAAGAVHGSIALRLTVVAALAVLALIASPALWAQRAAAQDNGPEEIIIGTGAPNGVYFHVGRSICRMVERNASGLSCQPIETDGSLFNLANLAGGAIEIGLAQSDWHYHAYNKTGPYEYSDQDFSSLRSLFSVHLEVFTVVARRDAGVSTFDDLRGKRVNIGNPGSGHRGTMDVVMAAKGWTKEDFQLVGELTAAEQVLALCHDRVQALTFMVGHPNPSIGKAVGLCGGHLVDVTDERIVQLVAETPYYSLATIPEDSYPASPEAIQTFGVRATVMSTAEVDEEIVYRLVKAVFEDLDTFKDYHPSFQSLDAATMIKDGLSAPLHPGAVRYYREIGLK